MKAAQVRISEYLISEALWKMDTEGWNIFYAFPTAAKVSQFVKGRVDPALDAAPYLHRHLFTDDVFTKRIKNGMIYFSGAQDPEQIVSCSADVVIRDEYELIPASTIDLLPKRYGDSRHKWLRDVSHPRYKNTGIHKRYQESDQRVWQVPCPHCRQWQSMGWDMVQFSEATGRKCDKGDFDSVKPGDIKVACIKCGKALNRLAMGRWKKLNPSSGIAGWHVTKLMSSRASLPELVQSSRKKSELEIQAFWNMDMGLPYSPKGANLDREILDGCVDLGYHLPRSAKDTFWGVDVGQPNLHVIGGRFIDDDIEPVWIGTVREFNDLVPILKRFGGKMAVVDAQPEKREAKRFAKKNKRRVFLASFAGMDNSLENIKIKPPEAGIYSININRTLLHDEVERAHTEHRAHLPANAPEIPDYYKHMMAPQRKIEENKQGKMRVYWDDNGKPDHYYLAWVYMIAAHMLYKKLGYRKRRKITSRNTVSFQNMGLISTKEDLG